MNADLVSFYLPYVIIIFFSLSGVLFMWILMRSKTLVHKSIIERLENDVLKLSTELDNERAFSRNSQEEKENLRIKLSVAQRDYDNLRDRYEEYLEDGNSMQEKFEIIANKALEIQNEKFDKKQRKALELTLDPLREKIKSFEEKVELTNKESIVRHTTLKTQIISLRELNEKITQETNNLVKALKGDSKTQGNWGELILESILEKSGLEKNREYFLQTSFTNENGKRQRPDVIIHLPHEKRIIIDSKVSITAYEQLVNSTERAEQERLLKAHTLSIKNHIDSLAIKSYHDLYKMESPDFVLMFVPIDSAFSISLSENPNLYSYAFENNIVIVTPSTLLATLKTVDTLWKNEKQQRHALEIAEEAGKMYDKFSALIEDLAALGKKIDQAKEHYQESIKKLHYGRGDLISRAEKLKKLGVKVKKEIPQTLVERSVESN